MTKESIPEDTYLPVPYFDVDSKSVLILTADKTEDLEFFYPYYRFIEEGFRVDVATPDGGAFKGKMGLGISESKKIDQLAADDYDLLFIPGGKAPAKLKENEDAIKLVQDFVAQSKAIASICHGPQVLAAAGVIDGHRLAAWPEVQEEIEAAGAAYVNEQAITDGLFITARWPADLPVFMSTIMNVLKGSGKDFNLAAASSESASKRKH